jgi:hypothetical protein
MGVVFLLGRSDEVSRRRGYEYRHAKSRLSSDSL